MSAARTPLPAPDMGGIKDDWARAKAARERAEKSQASSPQTGDGDATASRRHDATDGEEKRDQEQREPSPPAARRRVRAGRRPAPRAADAVALTVRFDQTEATEVDLLVLELREETGRRLDKAEIVRELLRLTREHTGARQALVRRLKG